MRKGSFGFGQQDWVNFNFGKRWQNLHQDWIAQKRSFYYVHSRMFTSTLLIRDFASILSTALNFSIRVLLKFKIFQNL